MPITTESLCDDMAHDVPGSLHVVLVVAICLACLVYNNRDRQLCKLFTYVTSYLAGNICMYVRMYILTYVP